MKKYFHIFVPVIAVLLCSLFLFTTLDDKVYDIFLRTIPSLTENKSIVLIKIDDPSVEQVGMWPWTRDIMADAIVFLREMGADSVAFDLSYLDKSPVKVDPKYVKEDLPGYLDYGFNTINTSVSQVMDAFASHQLGASDAENYKQQLLDTTKTVRDSLDTSISYVTRDVDSYFATTLRFFGNSYLTLTMVTPKDSKSQKFDMSGYNLPWLEKNIALKNIDGSHDTLTPVETGILPAIPELLQNAHGAGFVNAEPDADGYRRRVNLLTKYNGKYYGQMAFVAMLDHLGNPAVTVTNSRITLKAAHIGTKTVNITIPRAQDGSILINWPKKKFIDYNLISAWQLIGYNKLEATFVKNLQGMNDAGFFGYWDKGDTPLERYKNADYIKGILSDPAKSDPAITIDTWRSYRKDFLDSANTFLNGPYEKTILAGIDASDTATRAYVSDYFAKTRKQYSEMMQMRQKVAEKTANALCFIGIAVTSMTDNGLTTFEERFPNMGIYAAISNMILSGEFLDDAPPFVSILIALILSIGLGLIIKRFDTTRSLLAGIGTLAISVLALLAFFMISKRYIGVVVPFASVTVTFLTLSAVNFMNTIREKSFLRSAFSRYLSPAVISEIIADPSKLNLGGEKRVMTAIFTDIKGFSGISEKMDPAELVKLLNLYLTSMSNIVLENRGTIDKYEGDAIIAFFGAPIYMEEHAILACRTAISMKKAEKELNQRILAENLSPSPIFTRIGINSGDMIVGNMGTPNKMDYTVMGNAVNLAARLEGINKQYNTRGILISEHTRNQIGDKFLVRRLDRVRVVGVNTPLRLYELLSFISETTEKDAVLVGKWENAIDRYEAQDFPGALEMFTQIIQMDADDQVARLFSTRCSGFLANPPTADWDGVNNLTEK
jgi:adenylate cyclase